MAVNKMAFINCVLSAKIITQPLAIDIDASV